MKRFQVFTIENDVCCGCVIYCHYYVEGDCLYAHFLERFYCKWVLNFVSSFLSAFIEMIIWFLFFSLLTWYIISIHLYWRKYTLMTTPKPLTVWITTNCGKFFNRWEYQTSLTHLLRDLYAGQEATVRTEHGTTETASNQEKNTLRLYIVTLLI